MEMVLSEEAAQCQREAGSVAVRGEARRTAQCAGKQLQVGVAAALSTRSAGRAPVTRQFAKGCQQTSFTLSTWPRSAILQRPAPTSHSRTLWSRPALASTCSGERRRQPCRGAVCTVLREIKLRAADAAALADGAGRVQAGQFPHR